MILAASQYSLGMQVEVHMSLPPKVLAAQPIPTGFKVQIRMRASQVLASPPIPIGHENTYMFEGPRDIGGTANTLRSESKNTYEGPLGISDTTNTLVFEYTNTYCQPKTSTLDCVLAQVGIQGQHLFNYPLIFGH